MCYTFRIMAIVFAAVVPHPPLLLPTIGKEHAAQFSVTGEKLTELGRELYTAQPDAVVILSPHGTAIPDAICLNVHAPYIADFTQFGDLLTKPVWPSTAHLLTERFRQSAKVHNLPVVRCTEENLDYGTSIPLTYLLKNSPQTPILPFLTGRFSVAQHFAIGTALHDALLSAPMRIALIASVDLSHRVTEASPEGLSPVGVAYDNTIREIIEAGTLKKILDIDEEMDREARSCATRPLALMAGLIDGVHFEPTVYSYEQPFGTGYLVAKLHMP